MFRKGVESTNVAALYVSVPPSTEARHEPPRCNNGTELTRVTTYVSFLSAATIKVKDGACARRVCQSQLDFHILILRNGNRAVPAFFREVPAIVVRRTTIIIASRENHHLAHLYRSSCGKQFVVVVMRESGRVRSSHSYGTYQGSGPSPAEQVQPNPDPE